MNALYHIRCVWQAFTILLMVLCVSLPRSAVSTLTQLHPPSLICFHPHSSVSTLSHLFPPSLICFHPHSCVSTLTQLAPPSLICFHPHSSVSTLTHLFHPSGSPDRGLPRLHGCVRPCAAMWHLPNGRRGCPAGRSQGERPEMYMPHGGACAKVRGQQCMCHIQGACAKNGLSPKSQ